MVKKTARQNQRLIENSNPVPTSFCIWNRRKKPQSLKILKAIYEIGNIIPFVILRTELYLPGSLLCEYLLEGHISSLLGKTGCTWGVIVYNPGWKSWFLTSSYMSVGACQKVSLTHFKAGCTSGMMHLLCLLPKGTASFSYPSYCQSSCVRSMSLPPPQSGFGLCLLQL